MSAVNAPVRPIHAKQSKASEHCEHIKVGVEAALGWLHKTNALLIADQFAAKHECKFDARAAIIEQVEQHLEHCYFPKTSGPRTLPRVFVMRSSNKRYSSAFVPSTSFRGP